VLPLQFYFISITREQKRHGKASRQKQRECLSLWRHNTGLKFRKMRQINVYPQIFTEMPKIGFSQSLPRAVYLA